MASVEKLLATLRGVANNREVMGGEYLLVRPVGSLRSRRYEVRCGMYIQFTLYTASVWPVV